MLSFMKDTEFMMTIHMDLNASAPHLLKSMSLPCEYVHHEPAGQLQWPVVAYVVCDFSLEIGPAYHSGS